MKRIYQLLFISLLVVILFPAISSAKYNPNIELTTIGLTFPEQQTVTHDQVNLLYRGQETIPPIILAKRGGGFGGGSRGGSRSWGGGSKSRSGSSGNKSKSWGNKSKKTFGGSRNKSNKSITNKKNKANKGSKGTGSKQAIKKSKAGKTTASKKTRRKLSKADKQAAKNAKIAGKHHPNRKAARSDFKKKNAGKYSSKYAKKPSTRPSHIPRSTMVNGVSVNIGYNAGFGGYGYMSPLGTWMMYDMMTDAIMMDRMMSQQGYFIANERGAVIAARGFAYYFYYSLMCLVVCIVVLVLLIALMRGSAAGDD